MKFYLLTAVSFLFSSSTCTLADVQMERSNHRLSRPSRSLHYKKRHKEELIFKRKWIASRRNDHDSSTNNENGIHSIARHLQGSDYKNIYVNAQTGNDSDVGTSPGSAVRTLSRALTLVGQESRPLPGNLIINLSGTFERQRLALDDDHKGNSSSQKVVFRGDDTTRLLGGNSLSFTRVLDLASDHPARQLAVLAGASLDQLYAAPPPDNFPSNNNNLKWPDGDCRDLDGYGKSA